MKLLVKIGFIIALLVLFIMITGIRMDQTKSEIDEWASEYNYKVVHTEMQTIRIKKPQIIEAFLFIIKKFVYLY